MCVLQMVQNAVVHLVYNQLKWVHTTPLLTELHRLPVVVHIKVKSLVLTCRANLLPLT